MIFKNWSLALIAAALVAPLSASALGISVVGVTTGNGTVGYVEDGDTVTLDLVLNNDGLQGPVFGLDVGVFGYDAGAVGLAADNHLVFSGGQAGAGAFATVFLPSTPTLPNADGIVNTRPITEEGNPFPFNQERHVVLFGGVSLTGATGDGSFDNGVGGTQTDTGIHMQVTFTAQALGATPGAPAVVNLEIGGGQFGLGAVGGSGSLAFNNAIQSITIVPEPGTALLMGLGLAGLASRRR